MLIGELAAAVGIPTRTVRFYERKGLLPEPERAANGYRIYDESTLHRVEFIRSAQAAGLTLAEIGSIIDIRDTGEAPCTHVGELLSAKLAETRARRAQLAAMERELETLVERSRRLDPADCGDRDICHILRPDAASAQTWADARHVDGRPVPVSEPAADAASMWASVVPPVQ